MSMKCVDDYYFMIIVIFIDVLVMLLLLLLLLLLFRESKLTRLLQDSLGGNSRTFLIATLSPSM
jgi:hypothetical protein